MSSVDKSITICAGQNLLAKNRISELPDDILYHIVSTLPMKEVGRTSVLSKRWKDVWAYMDTLNFDSHKIIDNIWLNPPLLEVETPKYIYWVDQVVSLYKAPIIDEFRVQFDFTFVDNCNDNIDNWLRFAMEKRVKKLEMDFSVFFGSCAQQCYTFPKCCFSCNNLTSLELGYVNVTGEILESYLCNCLLLEHLSVKYSRSLVELTISGPLLKLKSLIISCCYPMKKLEISAPNLVSISYFGGETIMLFKSTPKLAQVSIHGTHANNLIHCFSDFSSYLSQIEMLNLSPDSSIKNVLLHIVDLVFPRLVKLVVSVTVYLDDTLCFFRSMLKACPSLLHFKLQLIVKKKKRKNIVYERLRNPTSLHYHLKTVEIAGFRGKPMDSGNSIDLDIAIFLIESAHVLEKITVDPIKKCDVGMPWASQDTPEKIIARVRAEQIRHYLKPGTNLEIL